MKKDRQTGLRFILMLLVILVIMSAGKAYSTGLNLETLLNLNPHLAEHDLYVIGGRTSYKVLTVDLDPHPFSFLVDETQGRIMMVQAKFYEARNPIGWYPWFDQAEGEPTVLMAWLDVYTQQVYLAIPEVEFERLPIGMLSYLARGGSIKLGMQLPLNFYDLKAVNPKLEHYQQLGPPVSEDGSIVLYAPQGPGMSFVTEENGDILALMFISPAQAGWESWAQQPPGEPLKHPVLGEIYTVSVFLRDREGRVTLDAWLQPEEVPKERVRTDIEGWIEPGFICRKVEFEALFGMLKMTGTMLNETGRDYMVASFRINIFDAQGTLLVDDLFAIADLADHQEAPIMAMLMIDTDINVDDLTYEIQFESAL